MKKALTYLYVLLSSALLLHERAFAQPFIHPGSLHSQTDLERIKSKVAAGEHPWIDAWNALIANPRAQKTYVAHPLADFGTNRQQSAIDAEAAYYNTLRWYISGDTTYAACAVRILNAWSSSITTTSPTDPLGIITINGFAIVGETLRIYPGWAPADLSRFQTVMANQYDWATHFLHTHNGNPNCPSLYPTSWEGTFVSAIIGIGVLCDNRVMYNDGVDYYKNGEGNGSIMNAVYTLHGSLGQTSESGRDQSHSQLGMANLATACQVAWNQGDDLYGYSNNRLLAGFEYEAQYNLGHDIPYTAWNNCINDNEMYIAPSQRGHNGWPNFEMVYNHYAVLKGLNAPNTKAMAELTRIEAGTDDLFGQGTLTYTLTPSAYPAFAPPPVPTGLAATPGISQVTLKWSLPPGDVVQGYNIFRSASSAGPYINIASSANWVIPEYTDVTVTNGTTYYYVISAINQAGTSANSASASAKPVAGGTALPAGWVRKDIGAVSVAGSVIYANVDNNTFILSGSGSDIGGTADSYSYLYSTASGDMTITTRLLDGGWSGLSGGEKVGIVLRESLDPNAKMLTVNLGELGNRYARFGTRSATAGNMNWQEGNHFSQVPLWLRLQRAGNAFTASQSPDGISWYVMGTSTVTMAANYFIGLSACTGSSGGAAVTRPTFDNVSITGGGSAPAAPLALTANALNSSRVKLTWSKLNQAAGYSISRSTASGGPYTTLASTVTDTAYVDSGLVASTTYFYVVKSANVTGLSSDSIKTSVQTQALILPPAPTGLQLTAGNARVVLKWAATDESPGSYSIKRSLTATGPYTVINSSAVTNYTDNTAVNGSSYYYAVSAVNAIGEGAASAPVQTFLSAKLTGTLIGTSGSYNNDPGTTKAAAIDSNLNTYFDANQTDGAWVGIDQGLGNSAKLSRVGYAPRSNIPQRMIGGTFQAANNSDFSDAVTLYTVSASPAIGVLTDQPVTDTGSYRYFRYYSPNGSSGNVAEVEFWGRKNISTVTLPPSQVTDLNASPGDKQVFLTWQPVTGATGYQVKRAQAIGGPFADVVTLSSTSYTDNNVNIGSTYFYTITGVNAVGTGPISAIDSVFLPKKLNGLLIGTSGSWNNDKSTTKAAAMDGNLNTYFDANQGDGAWVGLDLGSDTSGLVMQISFAPRSNIPQRMIGGVFQAANSADFSDAVTLYTVTTLPVAGPLTFKVLSNSNYFRYLRYLSPNGGSGNVAEVNFYGQIERGRSIPAVATGLFAGLGDAKVVLSWSPVADAESYIIKRATVSGGPYTTLIVADTATVYTDAAVNVGATYYYTVTSRNRKGNGPESEPVAILVAKKLAGLLIGTSGSWNNDPATTKAAAVDGNLNTFFDAAQNDGAWVGLDMGPDTTARVSQVSYAPRTNIPQRMVGGVFQGANTADFSTPVTLFTVTAAPVPGKLTSQIVLNNSYFRYLRYLSPNGGSGNVADVNFFGQVKRGQLITFNPLGKKLLGDPDFEPSGTINSSLALSYQSSDTSVATIVAGKIHLKAKGQTIITASQPGNDTFSAAVPVSQVLEVKNLKLEVQYMDGDNGLTANNIIRPYIKISNLDSVAVAYKELTMRYWFTAENFNGISTWIDYAQLGNSNVKMKYVALDQPKNGAFGYVEYSFQSTGNLAQFSNSGIIQSRFANGDWSNLTENDDYSFAGGSAGYAINNHITVYRNGVIVFGAEPAVVPVLTSLSITYQNQNQSAANNAISNFIAVNNTGNVPVLYGDITARYWFTKEGSQNLNYWIDYAKVGSGNISAKFATLDPVHVDADSYLEIAVNPAAGQLYPLSSSGNIQYRIAKADWSNFNELNDHSYLPKAAMAENSKITIYYKGQLIFGTEPAGSLKSLKSLSTASGSTADQVFPAEEAADKPVLYPNPVSGSSFSVKLTNNLLNKKIVARIRDINGRIIQTSEFKDNQGVLYVPISRTDLRGVYFVQLNDLPLLRVVINKP
ncbi:Alginate lyase [Mucilaginibacter gossypiicola]|uniref:Alginate lyase n=1 Tax=Mucilaginibacter gossypiicola TaxID=551995 RepID=A0A1H8LRK5_9SPHI|nr:cellulose binding domain-containing protein [Mucilaginibacter gossypiicola]SEO07724.1 Alginate lyase [Mucilaginibacter gossypiicola]